MKKLNTLQVVNETPLRTRTSVIVWTNRAEIKKQGLEDAACR